MQDHSARGTFAIEFQNSDRWSLQHERTFEDLPQNFTIASGVVVPAGTPKPIVDQLAREIARSLTAADVRERFTASGMEAIGGSPDEFAAFLKAETAKWAKVIKAANIKVE